LNDEKETGKKNKETGINQSPNQSQKHMLEAGTKRLLQLISINIDNGCCDDDNDDDNYDDDNYDDDNDDKDDDEIPNPFSMYPSYTPIYEEKKIVAPNGSFSGPCSISNNLVVIGASGVGYSGAAYLFHLDGTEVAKLSPENDGIVSNNFGASVSIDEKIVVGSTRSDYVRVFSRQGAYERTIMCDNCSNFGFAVATLGNVIVVTGTINGSWYWLKPLVYSIEGEFLKTLEQEDEEFLSVAISENFIVSTGWTIDIIDEGTLGYLGKTIIYSNSAPNFHKIAEIDRPGSFVAVAGERLVVSRGTGVWLYKTDGTLIKTLRQDGTENLTYGVRVAITDDKVLVGAAGDDVGGENTGSVFIYSAVTGEFIMKITAPDGEANDYFGDSVCASDSYFVVEGGGAAYLFQLP